MKRHAALVLTGTALVLFLCRGSLTLALLSHRPAKRPDTSGEPAQAPEAKPAFEYRVGGETYRVTPRFRWDGSGRVVGNRPYRWSAAATLIPDDLALAWGPLLSPPYDGRISYSQFSRFFFWRTSDPGLDRGTIVSHAANVHVIPSNSRLRRALRAVSKGDDVRLEGWLVDVDGVNDPSFHWGTSTTRDDEGPGSCETVYLTRLTVGERAYE
jgi:hypothetical protein